MVYQNEAYSTVVSLQEICWELKMFDRELTIESELVGDNSMLFKLYDTTFNATTKTFIGAVSIVGTSGTNNVYFELESFLTPIVMDNTVKLMPVKKHVPKHTDKIFLQAESSIRALHFSLAANSSNARLFRRTDSLIIQTFGVSDQRIDLTIYCCNFFEHTRAFPRLILEFSGHLFDLRRFTNISF